MLESEWMWWGMREEGKLADIWVFPSIFPVKYEKKLLADGQKYERCLKGKKINITWERWSTEYSEFQ